MAKKMTIVEQYEAIIGKVEGVLSAEEISFLKERAEMHSKKNASRKPTKAQTENEGIKSKILEAMEPNRAYTVTEIQKAVGLESNQKASALIRQLKEADLVVRKEEKGKAYFTKA
jgi:predicted transcriptional regulator